MTDIQKLNDKTLELAQKLLVAEVEKNGLNNITENDIKLAYAVAIKTTAKVYGC